MVKQRNEEQRRERFEKYFNMLDKDGSGCLSYEEFKTFLIQYNKKEMEEKKYQFFFNGADVDNGGTIDKDELWDLVEALQKNDQLYINKLFFRAIDVDKSGEIDAEEFVTMGELNGVTLTKEQAEAQIKKLTGGAHVMNFAQMHKALTGNDIPLDTDPYDGKLKKQEDNVVTRDVPQNKNTSQPGLSEEEKNEIRALIAKYDKSGNGKLEFDEFLGFMKEGLKVGDSSSPNFYTQMRFLYDGMDTDGSHNLDQGEIIQCLENFKLKNFKYITKMIFRGADVNHDKKVTIDELKLASENLGDKQFNKDDFEKQCKLEFGSKKKELEYWEFYKIITGETIDKNSPDYDPYEGKLPTKSKCCILI
ncbi:Rhomboid- protein 3 [Tritrichomonas musculus]|uniref:Rhomboid- protein 3 n=1 Tax=Tritrichomonas musculus TaxID=1915356 RepID=A0ABR2H6I5_9EUKA